MHPAHGSIAIEHLRTASIIGGMNDETMRTGANPEESLPPTPLDLPAEVTHPNITEMLLNAQLSECVMLLRGVAYLYREELRSESARASLVAQITSLMKASTDVAAMLHRMKGGAEPCPTIHQKFTVERIVHGPGGEGEGQIPKND